MSKKKIKNKKANIKETENLAQFDSPIKIGAIVISVFVVFYIMTGFLASTPRKIRNEEDVIGAIQYKEILAGETFNKLDKEYYVLYFDSSNHDAMVYELIANKYKSTVDSLPLYLVDLGKKFNEPFLSEDGNPKASKVIDIKLSGPTIIKIKNGKNILYKEGFDDITSVLN